MVLSGEERTVIGIYGDHFKLVYDVFFNIKVLKLTANNVTQMYSQCFF